jgi:hypothetical protein
MSHLNWTNPRACLQTGPHDAAALFAVSLKLVDRL